MASDAFVADFPTEIVKEGEVNVLVPKLKAFAKQASDYAPSKAPVFYNPVMELNRDLAVLALQAYQRLVDREISMCEPLTSCGLRGIRFAVEVQGVKKVVVNDINEKAYRLAGYNVKLNGLTDLVMIENEEANFLLDSYSAPCKRFDAIDVDPFGSPVHFLDSAVRALRDGGFLALTATDMAPLCGVHPRACVRKYGGKPLRTEYCHELAVRLLAGCLAVTAARYEMGVNVVFSHRGEHYVRVYATVEYGAKNADESLKNMGYILHCFKCFHRESVKNLFTLERGANCKECGSTLSLGGPMWLGRLFDEEFCELMKREAGRKTLRLGGRIRRMLCLAEAEVEAPISYYVVDRLCDALNMPVPSVKNVVDALKDRGFSSCLTSFNPKGIRSSVSASEIKEIMIGLNRNDHSRQN